VVDTIVNKTANIAAQLVKLSITAEAAVNIAAQLVKLSIPAIVAGSRLGNVKTMPRITMTFTQACVKVR
jgi:hypothetical protein